MSWKWFAAIGFMCWIAAGITFAFTLAILVYRNDDREPR